MKQEMGGVGWWGSDADQRPGKCLPIHHDSPYLSHGSDPVWAVHWCSLRVVCAEVL